MIDDQKLLILQRISEDDKTLEVLREVMLEEVIGKPNLNLNNEELGAETRAKEVAKQMIETAIKTIKRLKNNKPNNKSELNPGK